MSDIPEDIRATAKDVLAPIMSPDLASDYEIRIVARAIMAERDRCARIADRFRSTLDRDFSRGQHSAAHNIALAIRSGVDPIEFKEFKGDLR